MAKIENHNQVWQEVENYIPDEERCWDLVEMAEEEYKLVAQEETDAFFRKVIKEEHKQIIELVKLLNLDDSALDI